MLLGLWVIYLFSGSHNLLTILVIQFKYYHNVNSLWSVDYVRGLNPQITPYDDDSEDQNVQPGDVLNHGYKDELCLDYSVYDGRSTDYIPNCRDVDSPMKDMYALRFICMSRNFLHPNALQFGNLEWPILRRRRSPLESDRDDDVHSGAC